MTGVSRIYHQANAEPPVGEEAQRRNFAARKALWHKLGWAVLVPDEIHDDWQRQAVISLAIEQYGERNGG